MAIEKIQVCNTCGNIDTHNPCTVCTDARRDASIIVVVADVADLWALERAGAYRGRYHVLGGLLSALDGVGPELLQIQPLVERVDRDGISEVILALTPSVEGDTTSLYLARLLKPFTQVSRIAYGLPMGGDIKYADQQTLKESLSHRVEA